MIQTPSSFLEWLKAGSLLLTPLVSVIFFFGVLQSSIEMNTYKIQQHTKDVERLERITDDIKEDLSVIKKDIAVIGTDIAAIRKSMEARNG